MTSPVCVAFTYDADEPRCMFSGCLVSHVPTSLIVGCSHRCAGVGVFFGLFYYEEQRYRHHDAWYSAVSAALVYDLSQGQGASELQSLGMRASVTNPPKMAVSRCNSALQVRGPTLAVERYM